MSFESPHPDIGLPEEPFTDYVLAGARGRRDKPALVCAATGETLTYGELADAIPRLATGLARRGFSKGDVFGILCPNLPAYALAFHGVARAGGVNTTLNPLWTAEEIGAQLADSGARFLLTVPSLLDKARTAARASGLEEVFVVGEAAGATPLAALLAEDGPPPDVGIRPGEDVVALPYSSGTTGRPKGVMLTHFNLTSNCRQFLTVEPVTAEDVIVAVLPFFHIYGMVVVMACGLRRGATLITLPRFDFGEFLAALERHRVTWAPVVPPIVLGLAKEPAVERFDLSALNRVGSGAAPLGESTARACAERLGVQVRQGYGLTETSPVTHLVPPGAAYARKWASVGPALPNTRVRIADLETAEPLGCGVRGEVWVRGPQVMKGYLNRPDATARTVDDEGWLHTGDVGYVDEDGCLYLVDRAKELIKYKGFQVAPAELEDVLLAHPAIADCAVIPRPDEEAGEVPKAFVVRDPSADGSRLTEAEVLEWVAGRVAPYKKVRCAEFVDAIPKSASGKILRRLLVEKERGGAPG